jgi:hypothetical protein
MCFRHLIGEEVFKINFDCSRLRIENKVQEHKSLLPVKRSPALKRPAASQALY